MFAYDYPLGGVFLSMLYFFLFFIWIWILITVFMDIFRSPDLSGWIKALWCIFVIILPFLGVFIYLIARGGKMQERKLQDAAQQKRPSTPTSARLPGFGGRRHLPTHRAGQPQGQGVLTDAEFEAQKAKVLAAS